MARHLGTDHHELVVEPDAVEMLHQLVWHLDEPFADASAVPTFLVAKLARAHVKMVLTGDGGDERSPATTATCASWRSSGWGR